MRRLSYAVLLLLGLALCAYVTRDAWSRAVLLSVLRSSGFAIELDAIEWTGLHRAEISGLRLSSTDSTATLREVSAEHVAIDLDPWTLWRDGWRGVSSFEGEGLSAVVDASAAGGEASASSGAAFDLSTLSPLPRVDLRRVTVELTLADRRSIAVREASLAVQSRADGSVPASDLELHAREVEIRDADRSLAHPLSASATWSAGVLDLHELAWEGELASARGRVDVSRLHRGHLDAALELAMFGGSASLDVRLAEEKLDVHVRALSMQLARALRALLDDATGALDAELDFDATVSLPLANPMLTQGELHFDAFDVHVDERRFDWVRATIHAREGAIDAPEILLAQGENRLVIRDFSIPRDALDLCGLTEQASGMFEAELEDLPRALREAAGDTESKELADHRVRLAGRLTHGALELDRGQLTVGRDRVRLRRGHVPIDMLFDGEAKVGDVILDPRFELDFVARSEDLARVMSTFDTSGWEGSVEAAVRVNGSREGPRGFADVQARDLRVQGRELGSLSAHCELDRNRLDVTHLALEGHEANVELSGSYFFAERQFENAHAHAWVRDLSALGGESLPRGAVEIEADWQGGGRAIEGTLTARSDALAWGEGHQARGEVHARIAPASTEFVVRLVDRDLGEVECVGRIDGALADVITTREACFYVRDFRWLDDVELLALSKPVECVVTPESVVLGELDLSGRSGSLRASLINDEHAVHVSATAQALEITPWLARFVLPSAQCKTMNADVDVSWSPGSLSIDAVGSLEGVRWSPDSPEAALQFALGLQGTQATIQRFHAHTDDGAECEIAGAFPLDVLGDELFPAGDVALTGNLSVPSLARLLPQDGSAPDEKRGTGSAEIDISGTWLEPHGHLTIQAHEVTNVFGKAYQSIGPCGLDVAIELGPEVSIRRGALTMLNGAEADLTGRIRGPLNVPELAKSGVRAWDATPLDLHVSLDLPDLSPLATVVPDLRRMGGKIRGSFDIQGTFAAPDMKGAVDLSNGELRLATSMPSLAGLEARLTLDGDRVEIEHLDGEMGGAPVHLRGSIANWTKKPELDVALQGEDVLLFRTVGFILRADADLKIRGPVDALTVSGDLSMRDSRYTRDFDLLSMGKGGSAAPTTTRGHALFELDPPLDTLIFDVKLRSAEAFIIRTNVVRVTLRPELELVGTGALPLVRGTIFVDPGRVSLPTGTAYIRSGRIDYKAADPFVPDIEGLAEMRLQGYDITMRVSGDLEEPKIDVSSLPPLSREDLMLLVLTNRTPGEQLTLKSGQRAATDVAVFIARDVVSNWFDHGTSDDSSFADNFEVETGQEVSQSGVDTVRARFLLLKGRLGQRASIYLTGERDVYEYYNVGLRLLFRFK